MKVKVFDLHKKLIKFQNFQLEVQKLNDTKKPNVVVMFNIGEHSQKLINEMKLMGYTCEKYSLLKDSALSGGGFAGAPSGCAYLIFVNGIYRVDNSIQTYNTNSQYKTFVHYKLKTDDAKVFDFITTAFDDRIGIRKQQLTQLSNFASSCESGNVVVALMCNILPQHETSLETLFVIPGYHDAWFEKGTSEDISEGDNRSVRVWSSKLSSIISYSEHFFPGVNDDYDRYDEDFKMVEVVIE